jgi:hypothetical protein
VYLTGKAQGYPDLWLKDRGVHIKAAGIQTQQLFEGRERYRPKNDQRLFVCAYTAIY